MITTLLVHPTTDDAWTSELAARFGQHLPWIGAARLRDMLRPADRRFVVAHLDGQPAAIAGYGPAGYSRYAWALGPAVTLPEFQGRGLGRHLVHERLRLIKAAARSADLESHVVHVASRRPEFWREIGFTEIGAVGGTVLLHRWWGDVRAEAA